jgi:hypothetical protein
MTQNAPAPTDAVMLSKIATNGASADVFLGDAPVARIFRKGGNWQIQSPEGAELMAPIPHTSYENGRKSGIELPVVLRDLRDTFFV